MASVKDKQNRPVVVVTGMGVVTSLGAGKADNWKRLTAGDSGVRAARASERARALAASSRDRASASDRGDGAAP